MTFDIQEQISYRRSGKTVSGRIEITFDSIQDEKLSDLILGTKLLCKKARTEEISPELPSKPASKNKQKRHSSTEKRDETTEAAFPVGTKVVQISGPSPAIGVGIVMSHLTDGRIKVKFFKHVKVLIPDRFRRVTEESEQ